MTKREFRIWVEEKIKNKKIKKSLLLDMGFTFINGGSVEIETAIKHLEHGDVLVALKSPDKSFVVRSVLADLEKPFLTQSELINYLSSL